MSRTPRFCVAFSLLFLALPAQAGFEVTPFLGYRAGGDLEDRDGISEVEFDEDSSFGVAFNLDHTSITQWELFLSRQQTALQTSEPFNGIEQFDVDVDYYHIGGTYLLDGERVRSYVVATIGATRFNPAPSELDSETRFSMSIGVGLRYLPSERFGLRAEVRGFGTLFDGASDIFCGSVGGQGGCVATIDSTLMTQVEAWVGAIVRF